MDGQAKQGWHHDPTGRHAERYFIGGRLTPRVRDGGQEANDPVTAADLEVAEAARQPPREGWWSDPTGRHDHRWYSAGLPTKLVRDGRTVSDDPLSIDETAEAAFAASAPAADAQYQPTDDSKYRARRGSGWSSGFYLVHPGDVPLDAGGRPAPDLVAGRDEAEDRKERAWLLMGVGCVVCFVALVVGSHVAVAIGAAVAVAGTVPLMVGRRRRVRRRR